MILLKQMIILLIAFLLFLFVYIIFNVYAIIRVWAMRLPGDRTHIVLIFYMVVLTFVISLSLFIISTLNWKSNFFNVGDLLSYAKISF